MKKENVKKNLKFRYGFCCFPQEKNPISDEIKIVIDSWKKVDFGEFSIHAHPEADVFSASHEKKKLIVIGLCIPESGKNVLDVFNEVLRNPEKIEEALNSFTGRFVLFFVDENRNTYKVFNDAFGAQALFYSTEEYPAIASHPQIVAGILGSKKDEDVVSFMNTDQFQKMPVAYLPGDLTLYKGIYALIPNHTYNMISLKTERYWPKEERKHVSIQSFNRLMVDHLDTLGKGVSEKNTPVIGITGGIDSKIIFSVFHKNNIPFHGVTWGPPLAEWKELPTVRKLVDYLNIQHDMIKFSADFPDEISELTKDASGGVRGVSKRSSISYSAMEKLTNPIYIFGFGGEIIRGFYNIGKDRKMKDFSSGEMYRMYNRTKAPREVGGYFHKFSMAAFDAFRIRADYDTPQQLGYEPSDLFYWEHRMGTWGATVLAEMLPVCFAIPGINSRTLYSAAWGLADADRLTKDVFGRIIEVIDPDLSEIPYF